MNIRFYANLFNDYYSIQYRPGRWQENEMLCYSLRLNFWTKVLEHTSAHWFDGLQLFANAVYRSRTQTPLAEVDPYFTLDCGVSTDLFDRHLSLYFKVNDLFKSSNSHTVSTNPYYAEDYRWSYNSRFVSLGLTWRIGKMDLESKGRQGAAY